jgi:hypothetical protein
VSTPTSTLSAEQRRVLRNLAGWSIADALLAPEAGCAHLRTSMWGGSYHHDDIDGWFNCEARAINVKRQLGRAEPALISVPYTAITRYSSTIPASTRQELAQARNAHQAVNAEWLGKKFPDDAEQWPAHRDRYRAAETRLRAAVFAALPLDAAVQLDLFAATA